MIEHKIKLIGGYLEKDRKTTKETLHQEVVFGKRLTVKDLRLIDSNPQAKIPTMYQDLVRRQMITKFGTLRTPVPLTVLLSLDSIDRDDLSLASDKFLELGRSERDFEFLSNTKVKLPFGFIIGEIEYDVVEFGNRINGNDAVQADAYQGLSRLCFLIGRQISKISTSDNTASIEGQVSLDDFDSLDAESVPMLEVSAEIFRQTFRSGGGKIQGNGHSDESVSDDARNESERNGNTENAS